jgi:protocatechuate 3,4-dioxygenase alpha subunit
MTSPSQTVGPFFGFALPYDGGPRLVPEWHPDAITVRGRVLDGAGEPLPDALVEIWQADSEGGIPTARSALDRSKGGFSGFGRCPTDRDGGYFFSTVRPGGDSPYLAMLVFARGLLKPVATRVYFADDPSDPLLSGLDPERRATLIAESAGGATYRFDVHLQGDRETVFLAF